MTPLARVGKYRLITKIADGGMAEVFLAVVGGVGGFQKRVALKLILPHFTRDESFVQSFVNEARICGQLHHPNLVQVYEFQQFDAQYYLAMEFIEGLDLERIISHRYLRRVPIPPPVAVEIVVQMLEGLEYAHTATNMENEPLNIVHRDLKPSNILIDQSGVIKIVDFGVAKASSNLYKTMNVGTAKGTVSYMSPEQATGRTDLGPASDLFGVGSILYELLTLRRLFDGDNLFQILDEVRSAPLDERLARLPEVPPALVHVLEKALARDLSQRYGSAEDMARDLRSVFPDQQGPTLLVRFVEQMRAEGLEIAGINVVDPEATPAGSLAGLKPLTSPGGPIRASQSQGRQAASAVGLPPIPAPGGSAPTGRPATAAVGEAVSEVRGGAPGSIPAVLGSRPVQAPPIPSAVAAIDPELAERTEWSRPGPRPVVPLVFEGRPASAAAEGEPSDLHRESTVVRRAGPGLVQRERTRARALHFEMQKTESDLEPGAPWPPPAAGERLHAPADAESMGRSRPAPTPVETPLFGEPPGPEVTPISASSPARLLAQEPGPGSSRAARGESLRAGGPAEPEHTGRLEAGVAAGIWPAPEIPAAPEIPLTGFEGDDTVYRVRSGESVPQGVAEADGGAGGGGGALGDAGEGSYSALMELSGSWSAPEAESSGSGWRYGDDDSVSRWTAEGYAGTPGGIPGHVGLPEPVPDVEVESLFGQTPAWLEEKKRPFGANLERVEPEPPPPEDPARDRRRRLIRSIVTAVGVFLTGMTAASVWTMLGMEPSISSLLFPPPPTEVTIELSGVPSWGEPRFFGDPQPEKVGPDVYRVVLSRSTAYTLRVAGEGYESEDEPVVIDPADPETWKVSAPTERKRRAP